MKVSEIAFLLAGGILYGCTNYALAASTGPQPNAGLSAPGSPVQLSSGLPSTTPEQRAAVKQLWQKYNRLGELALSRKEPSLALEMFGHALDEAKLLNFSYPSFALTYDGLMKAYAMQGRWNDASQAGLEALQLREQLLGRNHASVGKSLSDLALIYQVQKRNSEADALLKRARTISQGSAVGSAAPDPLAGVYAQAKSLLEQGKFEAAAPLYEKVVIGDVQRSIDPTRAAGHLEEFAALRWQQGMLSQSTMLLNRAMAQRERANADSEQTRALLRNYARACALTGRTDDGAKVVQKLLQFDRNKLSPASGDFAFDLCTLGLLKLNRGEYSAAQMALESALDTQEKALAANHPDLADSCSGMARVQCALGNLTEAEKLFRRSLQIKERAHYPEILKADDLEGLARCIANSNATESNQLIQKASAIREQSGSHLAANPVSGR